MDFESRAACPEGKLAVNGGYRVATSLARRMDMHVLVNGPSVETGGGRGFWNAEIRVTNLEDEPFTVVLFANVACVSL